MPILRGMSRRDAVLILLGAISMQLFMSIMPFERASITINSHHQFGSVSHPKNDLPQLQSSNVSTSPPIVAAPPPPPPPPPTPIEFMSDLPETSIVSHAPGWTIYRDIYMANGTLFILSSLPSDFPEIRQMASTPLVAEASPENIAAREPSDQVMKFITPEEAGTLWGGDLNRGVGNRVWTVEGNTILVNDPNQFINHYYHFAAELLLGTWAFWRGAFTPAFSCHDPTVLPPLQDVPTAAIIPSKEPVPARDINRLIFANLLPEQWRDGPGFNAYFLRAAFPSVDVETKPDWDDRVTVTAAPAGDTLRRAWHFPTLLLADRSAAFRGPHCGGRTQRTVAEAVEKMRGEGRLPVNWWEVIRQNVAKFAGAQVPQVDLNGLETGKALDMPKKIVVTYISRQSTRRRLVEADHELLVKSLQELVQRKNAEWLRVGRTKAKEWELNVVKAEQLTKDEQVKLAATSSILLGVHGNGLTHLVLMPRSPISTVIEMFVPGGFAHDYEWTAKALGHKHFAIWNDTSYGEPNVPKVEYPEGFQGPDIPVYGPTVARLIEDRVAGLA